MNDQQQVPQSTGEAVKHGANNTNSSPSGGGDGGGGGGSPFKRRGSIATTSTIHYKPTCTEPHPNDVLCGRGGLTNQHVGNAHWRSLVAANKRLYLKLPKRQKMLVSESIVKAVRSQDPPGRFLKLDHQTKIWTDVGDRKAISKTSQALREGAPRLRGKMIAEETSSIASSLPYSESDAASVMSNSVASVSDLITAGQNQAAADATVAKAAAAVGVRDQGPQVVANAAVAKTAAAIFVEGDAASVASAYLCAAASATSAESSSGMAYMYPRTLAQTSQKMNMGGTPISGPGSAVPPPKTDDDSDYHSATGGGGSTSASAQTPLAGNMLMGPQSLAQVIATPNVNAGVTAGALTEQKLVQRVAAQQNPAQQPLSQQQEQQAMMPPPPPRLPQQPQQAQPQNMPQPQPQSQSEVPLQEQLQSPAQIQSQISQTTLMLKQLEMQAQSQGMQITPEQQAQYMFLMQQQQTLAQMFFLAQQQEQLALQQQQMIQQSLGGSSVTTSTMLDGGEGTARDANVAAAATSDEAKAMQPPLPALNDQEQQLPRRPSLTSGNGPGAEPTDLQNMMRTDILNAFGMGSASNSFGSLGNFDENDGKLPAGEAELETMAAAVSTNTSEQQKQREKPPGTKAQKRLSQEDLARWSRVKAMLAKTSSIETGDTDAAHVSHPGSSHGQNPGTEAPSPAAGTGEAGDEHDAATNTRNQAQTSLNRDVSMMSTLSGLSGILSVGEAGNFGLERGDTRGNGTVDMTDMMTRNISAAMSEMSLSRGPSLDMAGDIFGNIPNGGDSGLAPGSLTGLGDDDDHDDHEEQFGSLRNAGGPPNRSQTRATNDEAGNVGNGRNLTQEEQVQFEFLRRGTSLAGDVFGGRSS